MKNRYLIVVENKETEEQFLWNPFAKGKPVVPDGYYKITQQVPLNEDKYGNLPILETNHNAHRLSMNKNVADVVFYDFKGSLNVLSQKYNYKDFLLRS